MATTAGLTLAYDQERSSLPVGLAGMTCTFCMAAGSLAPWVHLSRLTISGWAGLGLPVFFLSLGAFAAFLLYVFAPRRVWLLVAVAAGGAGVLAAAVVCLAVWGMSGTTGLLVALIARGAHHEEFASSSSVSVGWGVLFLCASSFATCLSAFAGIAGAQAVAPHRQRWRVQDGPVASGCAELDERPSDYLLQETARPDSLARYR